MGGREWGSRGKRTQVIPTAHPPPMLCPSSPPAIKSKPPLACSSQLTPSSHTNIDQRNSSATPLSVSPSILRPFTHINTLPSSFYTKSIPPVYKTNQEEGGRDLDPVKKQGKEERKRRRSMELYIDEKWKLPKKGSRNGSFSTSRRVVLGEAGPFLKSSVTMREGKTSSGSLRSFSSRCASLVKEQRARFYIMRRCVIMLICWRDYP